LKGAHLSVSTKLLVRIGRINCQFLQKVFGLRNLVSFVFPNERISRWPFLICLFVCTQTQGLLYDLTMPLSEELAVAIFLAGIAIVIFLGAKRLRDLEMNPWLTFLPFGLLFYFYLSLGLVSFLASLECSCKVQNISRTLAGYLSGAQDYAIAILIAPYFFIGVFSSRHSGTSERSDEASVAA
jgi:uncharacterized membrane protein YhaH (DUF805 family)